MARPILAGLPKEAISESERMVAWLRLPAIGLIAFGQTFEYPVTEHAAFYIALGLFSAWSVGVLAWVYVRPVGEAFALVATAIDVAAISLLASYSGGAFSHARLAFFVIPITAAFRFRPAVTAAAVVLATAAYVVQALAQPGAHQPGAPRFIATQAGFLIWVGIACVLLSVLLATRTKLIAELAEVRARLLNDALAAEQRERQALAEALHDHALQNLLSTRHELQEASEISPHPALARADQALVETVGQLREAVFDLHPYVLAEAGLEAALRAAAQQAATQGHLALRLDLHYAARHPGEQLIFSAARELLANVVQHAEAHSVELRLVEQQGELDLVVADDGRGFPPERLAERLANGHIGLATQRVRVEAAGGRMAINSAPGAGTRVEIRLPGRS
jgi:two-component system NarL family sensor kinase